VKIVGDPVWERAQRNSVKTSTIYGKIERKLITWSLRQFDCVTTPGENLARTVESWSKKISVRVVQNGVQVLTRETSERKRFDLIVISRLVGWKNVDTVIVIANQLGCSLAIVGDGPQRKSLEIHASGNSNIVFFGARTNEEIQDLLKQSRVFCQLSDYEGLSFSLLQAMACSLPCVLSDIKANREVFEQDEGAAVFVHNRDSEGISTAISSLLHSRQIQNDLGVRAARIVRQSFNEADKMREMMELLINHD
jgi:glycosyltransferase involved in cell wall biosynthesis